MRMPWSTAWVIRRPPPGDLRPHLLPRREWASIRALDRHRPKRRRPRCYLSHLLANLRR